VNATFTPGARRDGRTDDGVSYAASGGQIAAIANVPQRYRTGFNSGRIIVPITPQMTFG